MFTYSLKLDEQLSPSETVLQTRFFDKENTKTVVRMVHQTVDNSITHGDVVDVMHDVFTHFLGRKNGVEGTVVDEINAAVVAKIVRRKTTSNQASKISRRVGFETNKIPSQFLARPSFSLESDKSYTFI